MCKHFQTSSATFTWLLFGSHVTPYAIKGQKTSDAPYVNGSIYPLVSLSQKVDFVGNNYFLIDLASIIFRECRTLQLSYFHIVII